MKSRVGERCRRIRSHLGSKSKDEQQVIQSHFATLVRRRATAPTGVERRTKERPRPREAFMRSIRSTLKKLGIDPSRLRGTWLALTESNIVLQESRAARAECPVAAGPSTTVGIAQQGALLPKPSNKAPSSSQVPQEDSDEKIIHLSGSARRTACSGIQVVKV